MRLQILRPYRMNRVFTGILEETRPGDQGADNRGIRMAVNMERTLTDNTDWELLQLWVAHLTRTQKPAKGGIGGRREITVQSTVYTCNDGQHMHIIGID